MSEDLLEAIEAVGVHQLPDVGARPLVLHPRLDQVDRVDGRSTGGTSDRTQREPVRGLKYLNDDASILNALEENATN